MWARASVSSGSTSTNWEAWQQAVHGPHGTSASARPSIAAPMASSHGPKRPASSPPASSPPASNPPLVPGSTGRLPLTGVEKDTVKRRGAASRSSLSVRTATS